jgi:hypothetical protein
MSEHNNREEARVLLKKITDFNVSNNYYQKSEKEDIARDLRKLLFIDDPTTRKFLEKWLVATKSVAQEFDLVGSEVEVEKRDLETPTDEKVKEKEETENVEAQEQNDNTETDKEEVKKAEETPKEEIPTLPESRRYKNYINRTNDLLLDMLDE